MVEHTARICGTELLYSPESVMIASEAAPNGQIFVLAAGADSTGLIYACLELKELLDDKKEAALNDIVSIVKSPDTKVRGVTRYVVNTGDNEWLYSEDFWHYMYRRMSLSRLNRIEIVVGFDTAYLSPPYPWFITVPGFEQIRPKGMSEDEVKANLESLRKAAGMAHDYGITFSFAPWQQKAWTSQQIQMLEALPSDDDELIKYTKKAVTQFLNECPEIDVFQLRVNHEAGIGSYSATYENYWLELIDSIAEARPVELEMRAKGLTDYMIQYANDKGLDVAVPTKYWCEHIAMPHNMTKMRTEELMRLDNENHSRRYSYADMLKKPRRYNLLFRLWNYGSCKVLSWGDWDYGKRFAQSCKLGGSTGFVITAPLGLLGGMQSLNQKPITAVKDAKMLDGGYEDERYLPWYYCFGRYGYEINQDSTIWRRMLGNVYGAQNAKSLETAYNCASYVLPLICTFHMPVHPSLNYSIEISTGGALFPENNHNTAFHEMGYLNAEPSDPQLFCGIDEFVDAYIKGETVKKYTPMQAAGWLEGFADTLEKECASLDLADTNANKLIINDFMMLAQMARYHSSKTQAALYLSMYNAKGDASYAKSSLNIMAQAKEYWQKLCDLGAVYADDLCFQLGTSQHNCLRGHWRDRMPEIERDIAQLEKLCVGASEVKETLFEAKKTQKNAKTKLIYPKTCKAGQKVVVKLETEEDINGTVTLHYRHQNLLEGAFKETAMQKDGAAYIAEIPKEYVTQEFDLLVFASISVGEGITEIVPGFWNADEAIPYCEILTTK